MAKKKVLVAMSGGVDSSVAAALLLDMGYEVIGVTMQIWPDRVQEQEITDDRCCSLTAVEDARRVADKLGIAYYVMNFKDLFGQKVIDYFAAEYMRGRTPNPCIACNRYIKFDALLSKAVSMGIEYMATGHYARVEYDAALKRYLLKKSVANGKDQTYALYNLTQEQLSRILMPVGEYTKEQIRAIAKERGLPVADKAESQEICFVPDNDYARFIEDYTGNPPTAGDFVDTCGNVLGRHRGIPHYTVGQRKGLGIAVGKPLYVVDIDVKTNRVVLGSEEEVFSRSLLAGDLNFISIEKPEGVMRLSAKIRYNAREAPAVVTLREDGKAEVRFETPQRAITPGQSVVFYDKDVVVGGGIIEKRI